MRRRSASCSGCRAKLAAQLDHSWEHVTEIDRLGAVEGGTVVSRGINYCTAFEIALKIRELSGLLFESWSAADLMHGPVAAIGPGWPVVAGRAVRACTGRDGRGRDRSCGPAAPDGRDLG